LLRHLHRIACIASLPLHLRSASFVPPISCSSARACDKLVSLRGSYSVRACRQAPLATPSSQIVGRSLSARGLVRGIQQHPSPSANQPRLHQPMARVRHANQPSNGPSHGAKRMPTIRLTPKPPSHITHTHHASRLCHGSFHSSSANIRAHAIARF